MSTAEVEAVVQNVTGHGDATVYGVDVHGSEGKAGMVAIVDSNGNGFDLEKMKSQLPTYSRPIFDVRLCKKVDMTGTYKLKKNVLQKCGYDPEKCRGDCLYFMNFQTGKYEPIDLEIFEQIRSGKIQF